MPEVFRSLFLVLDVHCGKTVDLLSHMKEVPMKSSDRQDTRKKVRRVATALTGIAGATVFAAAGTTPAMAGNNGQQVVVETSIGINAYYLQVCGPNQNGTWVCTPVDHNPSGANTAFTFNGWWFKGYVNVWGWKSYAKGKPADYSHPGCYVPTQNNTNYWPCALN